MKYRSSLSVLGIASLMIFGIVSNPSHVFAATLTGFSYSAASYAANATTTYTFTYTTATNVPATSNYIIYFLFPANGPKYYWNASQVASNVSVTVGGVAKTIDTGGGYLYVNGVAGTSALLGIPLTTAVPGGSTVVVTVQNVVNPSAGTYTWDPSLSSSFIKTATGSGTTIDGPASISALVITTPPDTTPPLVALTAPAASGIVVGSSVALAASSTDNVAVAGVTFYVDGTKQGSEVTSGTGTTYTENWNSTATSSGTHLAFAVARDTSNNYATSSVISFNVDNSQPVISSVTATTTNTTATVGWTTSKPTSSQVFFGPLANFGTSTPITNASPLVISHSVTIPALLSCTLYYYEVQSVDGGANTATSSLAQFVTSGCGAGTANILHIGGGPLTVASGATEFSTNGNNTLSATVPANVTATSSSLGIQIKQLDGLGSIPMPSGSLTLLASTTYDLKAIIDATTTLTSFALPVTVTITYDPSLLGNINASSLTMYHYHAGAWIQLTGCTVNTTSDTVSCPTPSFSTFALFGTQNVAVTTTFGSGSSTSGGGTVYGCKDPTATNYTAFAASNPALCIYGGTSSSTSATQTGSVALPFNPGGPMIPAGSTTSSSVSSSAAFTRNLKRGMSGADVVALQKFLIAADTAASAKALAISGTTTYFGSLTKAALIEYQKAHNITPSSGYFGPLTRTYITAH